MIPLRITGTASRLPGRRVSTEALAAEVAGGRAPEDIVRSTGIRARHHVAPEKVDGAALGAEVLKEALARAARRPEDLARLLFVSSTGGDQLIPGTAASVLERLGLFGVADGVDVNSACMGFLSALDLAGRCVATGSGPVGVVVVELLSPFISPADPRPYLVLADAVAAAVVEPSVDGSSGIVGASHKTDPRVGGVFLEHPGYAGRKTTIQFGESSRRMTELAIGAIRDRTTDVLRMAGVRLDDVDWVLPHQPNGTMFQGICAALGVPSERTVPIVEEVGSVGAASMAVSLDRLLTTRPVKPGQLVLLVGVGAGGGNGALLLRI